MMGTDCLLPRAKEQFGCRRDRRRAVFLFHIGRFKMSAIALSGNEQMPLNMSAFGGRADMTSCGAHLRQKILS